jgi:hypothetical protein
LSTIQYQPPAYSHPPTSYLERPSPSGLRDVLELILDKGLVIDIYVRVALVGIEILTIDARIVVASVDTYLRFAQAVNRLDLTRTEARGLPGLTDQVTGGRGSTQGVLPGASQDLPQTTQAGEGGQGEQARTQPPHTEPGS